MRLDLSLPVIQAPMAGGVTTPALVAGVTRAGGIGSFGFAYSSPVAIESDLHAVRALTPGPVNANFFVFPEQPGCVPEAQVLAAVAALKRACPAFAEIGFEAPKAPFHPDLRQQLEPVWKTPPALLSFHFGPPPDWAMERARSLGITVGVSVTSLYEALLAQRAGVDFLIAQGIEAGGHRGTFDPDGSGDDRLTVENLLDLLRSSGEVRLPLVAAGGIMDGADIARMLARGAVAVQMGTAFLACTESGASAAHKRYLASHARGVAYTRAFSGRLAQGLRNDFIERMAQAPLLPFPLQNALTQALRQRAGRDDQGEYQSLWAGAGFARSRALPVAQLMAELGTELASALAAQSVGRAVDQSVAPSVEQSGAPPT